MLGIIEEKGISYPLPKDLSDRKLTELLFSGSKCVNEMESKKSMVKEPSAHQALPEPEV